MSKVKLFFILAGVATVAGGGANMWLMGQRGEATSELESIKKEIQDEDEVSALQVKLRAELDESGLQLEHLEKNVAQTSYIPTLVSEVEIVANKSNLTLTGLKPKKIEEKKKPAAPKEGDDKEKDKDGAKKKPKKPPVKPYDEWQIEVSATGLYSDIINFLQSLKSFSKIVEVYGVSLNEIGGSGEKVYFNDGSPRLELNLVLKAYAFPDPTANSEKNEEGAESSENE
jgi:Tfp pilus assembly protein PilO